MKELFEKLAWKCVKNDLRFEYIPDTNGVLITNGTTLVAHSYLDNYSEQELELMHMKVSRYLGGETEPNKYAFNHTEYDRKMKEAGHTESDFM